MQHFNDETNLRDLISRVNARIDRAIEEAVDPLVARIVDLESQVRELQDRLQD